MFNFKDLFSSKESTDTYNVNLAINSNAFDYGDLRPSKVNEKDNHTKIFS